MEQILEQINHITSHDVNKLRREGKDFNFDDVINYIQETISTLNTIKQAGGFWDQTTPDERNTLQGQLENLLNVIKQIDTFEPTQISNTPEVRENLANQVKSSYQTLRPFLDRVKLYNMSNKLDTKYLNATSKKLDKQLQDIEKIKTEAENLLAEQQKVTGQTSISGFTEVFEDQSHKHLGIAVILGIAIIGFASFSISYMLNILNEFSNLISQEQQDISEQIQLTIAKLIFTSFLSYILVQLVRQFNAQMHLSNVNKHRANSLRVFKALVGSTSDEQTRNTLLVQASKTIFEAGDTGFISNDGSSMSNNIMIDPSKLK